MFHALRLFIQQCRNSDSSTVQLAQFENVPTLATPPINKATKQQSGPSNLQVVLHLLQIDGYFVCCWLLSPVGFGVPQHRLRIYIVAIPN